MVMTNHPQTKIRRRAATARWHIYDDIYAIEELKLDDVPFRYVATPANGC